MDNDYVVCPNCGEIIDTEYKIEVECWSCGYKVDIKANKKEGE